jgi:hypothetical protein
MVVRGGSSTGKTRAAYEAARLARWRLVSSPGPGALKERLDAGIPPGTVLWLGELRQFADADGGAAVLDRLANLLDGEGQLPRPAGTRTLVVTLDAGSGRQAASGRVWLQAAEVSATDRRFGFLL